MNEISFLNVTNVENSLPKTQDQTKDVINLVFLSSRLGMLKEITMRYSDMTNNVLGDSGDNLAYNKSIYQGYLKELREILTDFKDVNLRCSSDDSRMGKFGLDFIDTIVICEMYGEAGLNYLESQV
jgi:hypothetical protein